MSPTTLEVGSNITQLFTDFIISENKSILSRLMDLLHLLEVHLSQLMLVRKYQVSQSCSITYQCVCYIFPSKFSDRFDFVS